MTPLEHGVWMCEHPDCQVLTVFCNFREMRKYHKGTQYLYFSLEQARDYLTGRQSLAQLIDTILEK